MLAFVVDDASFDQDRLLPVKLFVWFTGFDKLCGVSSPGRISIGVQFAAKILKKAHKSNLESPCQPKFRVRQRILRLGPTHTSAYRKMRLGPGFPDSTLSFSSSFTLVTLTWTSFLSSCPPLSTAISPIGWRLGIPPSRYDQLVKGARMVDGPRSDCRSF